MKYLKKFEFQYQKYVEGDYVYVTKLRQFGDEDNVDFYPYCQIVFTNSKDDNRNWDYMVFLIKDNKLSNDYVFEKDITRKLTPEEIEEFKSLQDSMKFNL